MPFISSSLSADTVVVLDFETSGLSPTQGDRAIEIGAVLIERGKITERFQRLMNPGFRISYFIQNYTGISNAMLQNAQPCHEAMADFADFISSYNLVAHNASFDQRFLDAEMTAIQRTYQGRFACSMLLARRLFQDAPNHKLSGLVQYKNLPTEGVFHRALADAEMTAQLWLALLQELQEKHQIRQPSFQLIQTLSRQPKARIAQFLKQQAALNQI